MQAYEHSLVVVIIAALSPNMIRRSTLVGIILISTVIFNVMLIIHIAGSFFGLMVGALTIVFVHT